PSFSSSPSSHSPTETPSKFTTPGATPSEVCISNQMHNKYALSPETSAYANELYGIFNDDPFGNVDDPENLRHTVRREMPMDKRLSRITVPSGLLEIVARGSEKAARSIPTQDAVPLRVTYRVL
ncbi:hypothetical protein PMAYCL1PPCAC_07925, partial [Pristionchus mayeri]